MVHANILCLIVLGMKVKLIKALKKIALNLDKIINRKLIGDEQHLRDDYKPIISFSMFTFHLFYSLILVFVTRKKKDLVLAQV